MLLGLLRSACTPPARLLSHGRLPLRRLPWGASIRHRRVGGPLPGSHRSAGVARHAVQEWLRRAYAGCLAGDQPILNAVRPRRVPLLGPEGREYGITPAVARPARLKLRSFTSILHPARSPDERDAPHPRYVGHAAWLAWGWRSTAYGEAREKQGANACPTSAARSSPLTGMGFPPTCAIQSRPAECLAQIIAPTVKPNRAAGSLRSAITDQVDQAGENHGRKD